MASRAARRTSVSHFYRPWPPPTIALDRYYSGYSAAESLYAASRFTGWEDIIFGDPLGTPYAYGRP